MAIHLDGYDLTDVDDLAKELLTAADDTGSARDLILLALCRCISAIGSESELDRACRVIDEFSSIPHDWGKA